MLEIYMLETASWNNRLNKCSVTQDEDGICTPFARLQLDRQHHEADEMVFEVVKDCKPKPVPRIRWTFLDAHVNLGLPEFLVDR